MEFLSNLFKKNKQKNGNTNIAKENQQESSIVIRQEDGWAVIIKKDFAAEFIEFYRNEPNAPFPLSDNAIIVSLAAQRADLPKKEHARYIMQAHNGRKLVVEIKSAFDALKSKPSADWNVPCYMVFLYDNI